MMYNRSEYDLRQVNRKRFNTTFIPDHTFRQLEPTTQYHQIFRHSSEGLIVCNQQGNIELVNPRTVEMFGYTDQDDLLGHPIEKLIPREIEEKHVEYRDAYMKNPSTRSMGGNKKLRARHKDQSTFPVEVSLSYYRESGQLKVIAFVVDITKRVEVEEELNRVNAQLEQEVDSRTEELKGQYLLLQSIASNFPNGNIYALDRHYQIVWSDGQLLRKRGLTTKHLEGVSFVDRLSDDLKKELLPKLERVFKGESVDSEIHSEGNYFSLQMVPLEDEDNDISRILLVEMDVTPHKLMSLELARNLENEKRLNEMKSRFVSMASHEFRTPLSSIVSSATLIGKYANTEQQEKREKHITRIKKSVANLTTILNDFLSVDKLESGEVGVQLSVLQPIDLIAETIEEVEVVKKKGQEFRFSDTSEGLAIKTDPKLLKNICLNLFSNASKYSNEGQPIDILVEQNEQWWQLRVRDYGIGIPLDEQEQLFNRFFRAGNVTNIQGTGLGLSIVKKYLEILGGKIHFESYPEQGTEFIIQLPL